MTTPACPENSDDLYFMDTSSTATKCITLRDAEAFLLLLTGQGNIIGEAIESVLKTTKILLQQVQ